MREPIYPRTPKVAFCKLYGEVTPIGDSGAVLLFKAGEFGAVWKRIVISASTAQPAACLRVILNNSYTLLDPRNNSLYEEITIPAYTFTSESYSEQVIDVNLLIAPLWRVYLGLRADQETSSPLLVTAHYIDY